MFEFIDIHVHFDKCAPDYEAHFYGELGVTDFNDEKDKHRLKFFIEYDTLGCFSI